MPIMKKIIRTLAWKIFNLIENNGIADPSKNGEIFFIKSFLKYKKMWGAKEIVIFDVGANIGGYTILILKELDSINLKAQLHLFEQQKACFEVLKEKFKNYNNISINNFGLSDIESTAQLFFDKERSGLASLYKRNLKFYGIELNMCEEIYLKKAQDYIDEKKINHIDLVKIDVEGHELKVLKGFGNYLHPEFIDFI
jgi:FkbM family methyltransferase